MSEIDRLKRIARSWWGGIRKKQRPASYERDDARMIINDLGLQMSPEALTSIADNSFRREDMLVQIYNAEEDLGIDIIQDNVQIDSQWEPKVYEEEGKIAVTIVVKKEEIVIVEFEDDPYRDENKIL